MHAARAACEERAARGAELRPRKVLDAAWQMVQRWGVIGSATVCLVALHPKKPEVTW